MFLDITVNGQVLKALLDTRSALSFIKSCHASKVDYTNVTGVQCIHGDIKRYPRRAEVLVGVQEQMYLLYVAVVPTLPADMSLGRDLPVLHELINEKGDQGTDIMNAMSPICPFPVMTRAQAKVGLQPLPDLDSSLLQSRVKGQKKTQRQHRLLKYLGTPVPKSSTGGLEVHGWQVPGNIAVLQREDETLKSTVISITYYSISTPFRRIVMDIVGPLEKSSAGYDTKGHTSSYSTLFLDRPSK